MSKEELLFVPLGGAGEFGMNLNLYGFGPAGGHRWMMIDLGIAFGDDSMPGIDVIMPDPAFIEERRERLDGLVLTHAHEDHIGAVPYLWQRFECPIFTTRFTASVLRRKLDEAGVKLNAKLTEVPLNGRFLVGPFDLELVALPHSIPEPNAITIRTPAGTVLHTGDWKFDPDPVIGPAADEEPLRRLGDEGVLAIICDSTNVFAADEAGSEAELLGSLTELIGNCAKRVAVTCFASNVARLKTIAGAARANGRDVVITGRSLKRFASLARENGYLDDTPAFVEEEEAGYLPKDKFLIICTGSQGEPRAALARIAAGNHPNVELEEGDWVVFSSRIIPGNETAIGRVHDQFIRRDIEVITERDHFVHVSGHPNRQELIRMYQLTRPGIAVPVHGEVRHLAANARLAEGCQVDDCFVAENGTVLRLGPGPAGIVDHVPTGRLAVDGNRLVAVGSEPTRRRQILYNGSAMITLVLNGTGKLSEEPRISVIGVANSGEAEPDDLAAKAIHEAIAEMPAKDRRNDEKMQETVRIAVRRAFRQDFGKKPVTTVHLVRL
ncbi:MAG TPA: ribonuclease J [Rhodospirillales bacterium]|jgi:ribonuclease J|nr:ribonuclease J [Rhodospirillales bacterium]